MDRQVEYDRIDCEILESLQKNARIPNKQLAERLGIAPSTCLERVRRLHAAGAFRGFHAEVEPEALGIGLQAFIAVQLTRHTRVAVEAFRAHALGLPEVHQAFHMAGENDFLLQVVVRDAEHLRQLALSAFTERDEVARIQTSLIFEHVRHPVLPNYLNPESHETSSTHA